MAKTYDPKADYVCVSGMISLKDPKTNDRTLITPASKGAGGKQLVFKLTHLQPHEIAFLVEVRQVIKLAGGKS